MGHPILPRRHPDDTPLSWRYTLFWAGKLAHRGSKQIATLSTILHLKANRSWSWWGNLPLRICDFSMITQLLMADRYAATYYTCRRRALYIGFVIQNWVVMEKSHFLYWVMSHLTLTDIVCGHRRACTPQTWHSKTPHQDTPIPQREL